ncbi:unnamed protein product [Haemonchus placei]|uniref:Uncharacterized protein n=1 Tax=Haemonchus placei TaxID=6290 RepID=A0A0N4W7Y0_HAEPC|nr:unnamed protein product [Haemonchus placei]
MYLVFTLCAYLYVASGADVNVAQEIPLEAQTLSGEPLVAYLRKNQNLFKVNSNPTPGFKQKIMDIKFRKRNPNLILKDDPEPEDDIPEE